MIDKLKTHSNRIEDVKENNNRNIATESKKTKLNQ